MLDQDLYRYVKFISSESGYLAEEQVEFAAKLERACKDNPDLPLTFTANCLLSLSESRSGKVEPFLFS